MKILILGLGVNGGGTSAARYFAGKAEVRISDIGPRSSFGSVPEELEALGIKCYFQDTDPKENIKWADVVIKNPAVPSKLPQLSLAKNIRNDFYYLFSSPLTKGISFILVTGTKGKSTTVAAITHALNGLGSEALYCGNIGVSAFLILEELERRKHTGKSMPSYIVAELSSWQIHDTYVALNGHMPSSKLTILTSLYRDHQNRYSSLADYYDDKLLLLNSNAEKILVNIKNKRYVLMHTHKLSSRISAFPSISNPYSFSRMELACAYRALRLLSYSKNDIIRVLSTYKGMPHRIEQVAVHDDIMFINDSSATISEAVSFSVKTLYPLSYHLICGGTDKDINAEGMLSALQNATSITLLDGSFTKNKLIPLLESHNLKYSGPYRELKAAFTVAVSNAEEKKNTNGKMQVVILSPGAASFELFRNEFDRGEHFKQLVLEYVSPYRAKA